MTKLFQLCTGSLRCSKYPLVQELLNYLILLYNCFKMVFNHVEHFHDKRRFYCSFKKFWVVENSPPISNTLNKTNAKKKTKTNETFEFRTLYTTIPHNLLINVILENIKFVYNAKTCTRVGFSSASVY